MSETPQVPAASSEPVTSPVTTGPVTPPHEHRRSRLTAVATWVGIVAGVVFIVAVIFFSGFVLGARTGGGHHGWGHHRGGEDGFAQFHRGPMMFPMGPRGEFPRSPFGPGGPGGPGMQSPGQTSAPATTAPSRP
jgi:hypothetical protein